MYHVVWLRLLGDWRVGAQGGKSNDTAVYKKKRVSQPVMPTLDYEQRLWASGRRAVAGIDEAGRGALAGPVMAAAVILPPGCVQSGIWAKVRDSKLIAPAIRAELADAIKAAALAWGVGLSEPAEIDRVGIAESTRRAMQRALGQLSPAADYLLIDWVRLNQVPTPQESLVKADQNIVSVAAASILAKVTRDARLVELDKAYPGYGFGAHKGYGTRVHLDAIATHGPCAVHRHSFAPIAQRPTLFEQDPTADAER